jgi:hypothetical protein
MLKLEIQIIIKLRLDRTHINSKAIIIQNYNNVRLISGSVKLISNVIVMMPSEYRNPLFDMF